MGSGRRVGRGHPPDSAAEQLTQEATTSAFQITDPGLLRVELTAPLDNAWMARSQPSSRGTTPSATSPTPTSRFIHGTGVRALVGGQRSVATSVGPQAGEHRLLLRAVSNAGETESATRAQHPLTVTVKQGACSGAAVIPGVRSACSSSAKSASCGSRSSRRKREVPNRRLAIAAVMVSFAAGAMVFADVVPAMHRRGPWLSLRDESRILAADFVGADDSEVRGEGEHEARRASPSFPPGDAGSSVEPAGELLLRRSSLSGWARPRRHRTLRV